MTTPSIIRKRRLALGYSQHRLAREVSIELGYTREAEFYTQPAVAGWESEGSRKRPLTAEVLVALASVLNIDTLELLGGVSGDPRCAPVLSLSSHASVLVAWVVDNGPLTLVAPDGSPVITMLPAEDS